MISKHYAAAVVIPCYNEEKRLDTAVLSDFGTLHPEILFVLYNDGSSDRTQELLQKLESGNPASFVALDGSPNSGKAEAVRKGILTACEYDTEFVGFWDADFATPLEDIVNFLEKFEQCPQLNYITGARLKRLGCDVRRKVMRHYLGRIFATLISIDLRLPTYDTQCGAKLMRRELAEKVFDRKFVTKWFFDVEILKRLIRLNGRDSVSARTLEYPVSSWRDVGDSKVKMFSALYQLIQVLFFT